MLTSALPIEKGSPMGTTMKMRKAGIIAITGGTGIGAWDSAPWQAGHRSYCLRSS